MEKNSWLKVVIVTDVRLRESLSDFLVGTYGAGVDLAAPGEPGCDTITAWLEVADSTTAEQERILSQIEGHVAELQEIFKVSKANISWERVEDQNWSKSWKKHFTPFAIIKDLVIVPSWEEYIPKQGEQILAMDPGMAFGTGHHDTTTFSLKFIRDALREEKIRSLLDVGTGTGILGMAALLFGAEKVVAIDNDPDAVAAAQENVKRNRLEAKMEVSLTPLTAVGGQFSLVVANIVHDVLVELADDIVARLAPAGHLILSGLLHGKQVESIKDIYTSKGLLVENIKEGDEWGALWLKKCSVSGADRE